MKTEKITLLIEEQKVSKHQLILTLENNPSLFSKDSKNEKYKS